MTELPPFILIQESVITPDQEKMFIACALHDFDKIKPTGADSGHGGRNRLLRYGYDRGGHIWVRHPPPWLDQVASLCGITTGREPKCNYEGPMFWVNPKWGEHQITPWNSIVVNEYEQGDYIKPHIDPGQCPMVRILSMGCPAIMTFGRSKEEASLMLKPRSVMSMSGPARFKWTHAIQPVEGYRISIAFRTRNPRNKTS